MKKVYALIVWCLWCCIQAHAQSCIVNAGHDTTVCGSLPVTRNTTSSGSVISYRWSSSGAGTFSPSGNVQNPTYLPAIADYGTTVTLTMTGYTASDSCSDIALATISIPPSIHASPPSQSVCSIPPPTLFGVSSTRVGATGQTWTTSGTGIFIGTTYHISGGDIASGHVTLLVTTTGNGVCTAAKDSIVLTFTTPPIIDAGPNQSICSTTNSISLHGNRNGGVSQVWSSSGTGTFSPSNTTLTPTYTLSAADKTHTSIILRLTSTGGGCTQVKDSMILSITPAPTASAGPDMTVCTSATSVPLTGVITNATGQVWITSGDGFFSPSYTTLSPAYFISPIDKLIGSVRLTITTNGSGICPSASDTMTITFVPGPVVDAGANALVCTTTPSVSLSGSRTGATGQVWSTNGTGTFLPSSTALNPTYIFSATDKLLPSLTMKITSTGNGICTAATDSMIVTFQPAPVVSAGPDVLVCTTAPDLFMAGSRTGGTGQLWTTNGTGTFSPSATVLNPDYIFSAADKLMASFVMIITSTGNGICPAAKDTMTITFQTPATVNAGFDNGTCLTNLPTYFSNIGSREGGTGQRWTTTGAGTFSPNDSSLSFNYYFAPSDSLLGVLKFYMTSTGNGPCAPAIDSMFYTMQLPVVVDAGPDQSVCFNANTVSLHGSLLNGSSIHWATSGTGTFSPNDSILDPVYHFTAADSAVGFVYLSIRGSVSGSSYCGPAFDSMRVNFIPAPIVDAGSDQAVCGNGYPVLLNGSVTNAPGGKWSSSGTGYFYPNDSTLNAEYIRSSLDSSLGFIQLTLRSLGGVCSEASDSLSVTFVPSPFVFAGSDTTVCNTVNFIHFSAATANVSSVRWYTEGSGSFEPSDLYTFTLYYPSVADKAAGSVNLFLIGYGNANCPSDTSSLTIHFTNCQDTCNSVLSFSDSLEGKTIFVSAAVSPSTDGYYQWNFGDGTFASGPYASHTYGNPGTYAVCVDFVSYDSLCHLHTCKTVQIKKCYVSVTFTKEVHGDTAYFNANVTPATPGEYFWDFGDGVIGKGQNVLHIYAVSGVYPVTLSYYSSDNTCVCEAVYTDSVVIKVCPKIYFDQTVDGTTITLTGVSNTSTTGTWYWDFGDGTYGTGDVVTHNYEHTGTYPVLVEFYSHNGTCQCLCHSEYEHDVKAGNCSLEASFTDSIQGNTVIFQAYPAYGSNYYFWNFGDGGEVSTPLSSVLHTYSSTGTYMVSLTVVNTDNPFDTCTASVSNPVDITPSVEFRASSISVHPNPAIESVNYQFNDEIAGTAESVQVLNGMGAVVKQRENIQIQTEGNTIELDQLAPGLYMLKVTSGGKIFSKQFLKN